MDDFQNDLRLENSVKFAKISFELEEDRERDIKESSWRISIYCLLISLLVVFEYVVFKDKELLTPLMLNIAAFILSLLSQWRFDYETMIDGKMFAEALWNDRDKYQNQSDYDYQMIHQLTAIQRSKKCNNNARVTFIKQAIIFLFVSCAVFVTVNILIVL